MTTFFALLVMIAVVAGMAALLERANRRTAGQPRSPYGADPSCNADLARVLHDLDVHRWA